MRARHLCTEHTQISRKTRRENGRKILEIAPARAGSQRPGPACGPGRTGLSSGRRRGRAGSCRLSRAGSRGGGLSSAQESVRGTPGIRQRGGGICVLLTPPLERAAELAQHGLHPGRADQVVVPQDPRAERAVGQQVVPLAVKVPDISLST